MLKSKLLCSNPLELIGYQSKVRPASVAQWANALTEPQYSGPGWLAQAMWVRLPLLLACRSGFLHAMRLNSRAGTEGSPVSSCKCDRPSHPDWGRLGVRAAGVDNRWHGPVVL